MTAERTAARREENLFLRGQFSGKSGVCVCVCLSCLLFVPETNSGVPPLFTSFLLLFFFLWETDVCPSGFQKNKDRRQLRETSF